VNYNAVADCSEINLRLFKILQKRAKVVDGISYADPNFLRMMMYLELSRPRGEVDRWKKVFERLTLLNHEYPLGRCEETIQTTEEPTLKERDILLKFCIRNKRVLAGPDIIQLYEHTHRSISMKEFVELGGAVLAFSPQARMDAEDIKDILGHRGIRVDVLQPLADGFYETIVVRNGKKPLAMFFQESACHSYTIAKLRDGPFHEVRIGTPDLLLHMYYSLEIASNRKTDSLFFATSLQCLIDKLFQIQQKGRREPTEFLPAFGLRCSGRQKGLATLLKERSNRTEKKKGGATRSLTRKSKRQH
jgi:hypothetical protein